MAKDENRSRAKGLLDRARASLSRASAEGMDGLRRTRGRVSEALGTAAERIAETETGERLKGAIDTQRVIKRALDAQARGNTPMAYRLLEEKHRERPEDEKLALAFWNIAASNERAEEGAPAVLRVLRSRASRGELEETAKLWLELVAAVPGVRFDAGSLIRIVPVLEEMDHDKAVAALRLALDQRNSGLTAGLAARAAELARSLDPPSAAIAARVALESPEIDDTKRARLEALAKDLEEVGVGSGLDLAESAQEAPAPAAAQAAPAPDELPVVPPAPTPEEIDAVAAEFSELVVEEDGAPAEAPAPRFTGIKSMDASPLGLLEEGVKLALEGGRKATLAYEKIEALGVGEVAGSDGAGIRIDLILNWHDGAGGSLRVVRLRGDRFDPEDLASEITGPQTLRGFLAQLLSRSDALPLPDVDGALGDPLHVFEDEDDYRREVLLIE